MHKQREATAHAGFTTSTGLARSLNVDYRWLMARLSEVGIKGDGFLVSGRQTVPLFRLEGVEALRLKLIPTPHDETV